MINIQLAKALTFCLLVCAFQSSYAKPSSDKINVINMFLVALLPKLLRQAASLTRMPITCCFMLLQSNDYYYSIFFCFVRREFLPLSIPQFGRGIALIVL